jgi:isoleucyl-tRNA synthetase
MYDFKEVEKEILEYWRKINLLKKINEKNKLGKEYFLLDGPPYANDIPHVGHIRNTVYKDFCLRIAQMKGFNVLFQPGFDTHGLPIENKVEKELNLKSKKDIEKLGVSKFTEECRKWAIINKNLWIEVYDKLGSWYSWKEPYLTYNNSYIESGWWAFKRIWDKGMVYEGKKPVFWCPLCETALAGYEVTDSYVMKRDPIIYIKFKIKDKDEFLFVFTTTPWTLFANVAVVAHPDEDYVKVETTKGVLILAKKRLELLTELEIGYKIIDEFKGKELDGLKYEPLLDVPIQRELERDEKALRVYMSIPILKERVSSKMSVKKEVEGGDVFEDFVSVEEGTGLVHCAPGHGKTDNELGHHYRLPELSPLDSECRFTGEAGDKFKGRFVKEADNDIIKLLEEKGKIVYHSMAEHKYPVCWRCKSPLIFRMSKQWFLKVDMIKDKMLEANSNINWMPGFARERFANWIINAEDWNISRQRYWGIPMPIWKCSCGEMKVIGSKEELGIDEKFDLHNVNDIKLKCEKCEGEMKRINEIFDVWFDSGIAPWASLGYPFENEDIFKRFYPVSRVNESQDQIRGWFYSLMFCGVATFDKEPYEAVSMPGWVVDEKGNKMSKSEGNVIWAKDGLEEFGADSLRFYYMWDVAPYELQKFNRNIIKSEVYRFLNVLWNLHIYLKNNCDEVVDFGIKKNEDRWILSKLNSLIRSYDDNLENFEYHNALRSLAGFILNDLSREYIQIVRERVDRKDKAVFYVLNEVLFSVLKLVAPVIPFISEKVFLELSKHFRLDKESIHLERWPMYNDKKVDKILEEAMSYVKPMVQEILFKREKERLNVRWPLPSVKISCDNPEYVEMLEEILKKQINVKKVIVKKGDYKIELDTKLDDNFKREGYARELIRRVQMLRKKKKLNKRDKINLVLVTKYDFKDWEEDIKEKVNAFEIVDEGDVEERFEIRGESFGIGLKLL